jgi:hypothetical protein
MIQPLILPKSHYWAILITNEPYEKNNFFVAIMLAQKCETSSFQQTLDKALESMYFPFRSVCNILSSIRGLKNNLPRRALFFYLKIMNPKISLIFRTPKNILFIRSIFLFLSIPFPKQIWI